MKYIEILELAYDRALHLWNEWHTFNEQHPFHSSQEDMWNEKLTFLAQMIKLERGEQPT